jgi:hypothetical protein
MECLSAIPPSAARPRGPARSDQAGVLGDGGGIVARNRGLFSRVFFRA